MAIRSSHLCLQFGISSTSIRSPVPSRWSSGTNLRTLARLTPTPWSQGVTHVPRHLIVWTNCLCRQRRCSRIDGYVPVPGKVVARHDSMMLMSSDGQAERSPTRQLCVIAHRFSVQNRIGNRQGNLVPGCHVGQFRVDIFTILGYNCNLHGVSGWTG